MQFIKRIALVLVLALWAGPCTTPASARFLHRITEAQAYAVAGHFGEVAFERDEAWAEGWWRECSRQTPWTFSCMIEVWSEVGNEPKCERTFDVASSVWTGRLRTEDWSAWNCDP